jgi:putative heme-binding domain-containing protein
LLICVPLQVSGETLQQLLNFEQPQGIQLASLDALAGYQEQQVAEWILDGWDQQTPAVRSKAQSVLLSRPQWTLAFLKEAVAETVGVAQVDSIHRSMLLKHSIDEIQALATQLFEKSLSKGRAEIMESYQQAVVGGGDSNAGQKVFARVCRGCHRLGAEGHAVGPDLASSPTRDAAALLSHILDPNRYVLPNFESYVIVNTSGRIFTGIISSQTTTSVTLKRADNQSDTILRTNIDELVGTGKSMMPDGLENKVNVTEMSDLIAYLQAAKKSGDTELLPIGTLPGLTEPALQATKTE